MCSVRVLVISTVYPRRLRNAKSLTRTLPVYIPFQAWRHRAFGDFPSFVHPRTELPRIFDSLHSSQGASTRTHTRPAATVSCPNRLARVFFALLSPFAGSYYDLRRVLHRNLASRCDEKTSRPLSRRMAAQDLRDGRAGGGSLEIYTRLRCQLEEMFRLPHSLPPDGSLLCWPFCMLVTILHSAIVLSVHSPACCRLSSPYSSPLAAVLSTAPLLFPSGPSPPLQLSLTFFRLAEFLRASPRRLKVGAEMATTVHGSSNVCDKDNRRDGDGP